MRELLANEEGDEEDGVVAGGEVGGAPFGAVRSHVAGGLGAFRAAG